MTRKVFIVANLPAINDREKFKDYERGLLRSLGRHEIFSSLRVRG